MTLTIEDSKQLAASLRAALKDVADPAELSHAQCLDLLARTHGQQDWNTLRARLWKTYFYNRHEPYLPNSANFIRALSVRKAVLGELCQFAENGDIGFNNTIESMRRMRWQVEQVRRGKLRVEPELSAALSASEHKSVEELRQEEQGAANDFEDLQGAWGVGPYSVFQAERYQNSYVHWRLTSFSLALKLAEAKAPGKTFESLALRKLDVYSYAACLLAVQLSADEEDPDDDALYLKLSDMRRKFPETRVTAKALMLGLIAGDSVAFAPGTLAEKFKIDMQHASVRVFREVLDGAFPEFAAWQAWVEMKPLYAVDADSFHNRRV